jgi:WD repeat, SAM and U-box domain-containing protein 1
VSKDNPDFCCPIGRELMRQPVILTDEISYEKKEIEEWFSRQEREGKPFSSPMTRALVSREYVVNRSLKNAISTAVEAKLAELGKRKRGD